MDKDVRRVGRQYPHGDDWSRQCSSRALETTSERTRDDSGNQADCVQHSRQTKNTDADLIGEEDLDLINRILFERFEYHIPRPSTLC